MCTVTWSATDEGFDLFCNRDERHERAVAEPPRVGTIAGTRLVAPRDPDGGGSWLAANEHGLVVCLLNGYRAEDDLLPAAHFRSRGLLLMELAAHLSAAAARDALEATDLTPYRSFELLAHDADGARLTVWNRATAQMHDEVPELPLVSCPVRTDEVRTVRRRTLDALVGRHGRLDTDVLAAFHRSRHPAGRIWSVAMEHEKAATRSHAHVRVRPGTVAFTYVPGRPDVTAALPTITLDRARHPLP